MGTSLRDKIANIFYECNLEPQDADSQAELVMSLIIAEGWRVPQKPLDHKKAEELLEKLYWNTK